MAKMKPGKDDDSGEKKRKKKTPLKDGGQENSVVKKKRKLRNDELISTPKVKKLKKEKTDQSGKIKNGELEKKPKSPKKIAVSPSPRETSENSSESKMMDYKQYRLKKKKEEWKQSQTKRVRKAGAPIKSSLPKKPQKDKEVPQKKQEFGVCDFVELVHYWNEFAASSLTSVEADELSLSSLDAAKVVSNTKGRKPDQFFTKRVPDWKRWLKKKTPASSPRIIVVCSSAIRAAELNRELAPFKTEKCRIVKLIRKDKAKSQADQLASHTVHMAIGTPHRIHLLLSRGGLKLDACNVIALDWANEDVKKRRLITISELRSDMLDLFKKHFIPMLKERGDVSLFLF